VELESTKLELTGVLLNRTTSNKKRIFSIPELSPLFPQEVKDVHFKGWGNWSPYHFLKRDSIQCLSKLPQNKQGREMVPISSRQVFFKTHDFGPV